MQITNSLQLQQQQQDGNKISKIFLKIQNYGFDSLTGTERKNIIMMNAANGNSGNIKEIQVYKANHVIY